MSYSPRDEALTISRGYRPKTINLPTQNPEGVGQHYAEVIRQPIRDAVYTQPDPVRCEACDGRGMLTDEQGNLIYDSANQRIDCKACGGLGATFPFDPRLPTDFAPGSWQKQLVLQARYELGGRLFVAGDRINMDSVSFPDLVTADADDDDDDFGGGSSV
ncbi:MAG: hypothetical protein E6Q97_04590 [Desulfurellales bacterium]|nr:MAG: hypothetical protein E6Q97_04590 [Desulfurellales bacterium]